MRNRIRPSVWPLALVVWSITDDSRTVAAEPGGSLVCVVPYAPIKKGDDRLAACEWGTIFTQTGRSGDWYKVAAPGYPSGYMHKSDVLPVPTPSISKGGSRSKVVTELAAVLSDSVFSVGDRPMVPTYRDLAVKHREVLLRLAVLEDDPNPQHKELVRQIRQELVSVFDTIRALDEHPQVRGLTRQGTATQYLAEASLSCTGPAVCIGYSKIYNDDPALETEVVKLRLKIAGACEQLGVLQHVVTKSMLSADSAGYSTASSHILSRYFRLPYGDTCRLLNVSGQTLTNCVIITTLDASGVEGPLEGLCHVKEWRHGERLEMPRSPGVKLGDRTYARQTCAESDRFRAKHVILADQGTFFTDSQTNKKNFQYELDQYYLPLEAQAGIKTNPRKTWSLLNAKLLGVECGPGTVGLQVYQEGKWHNASTDNSDLPTDGRTPAPFSIWGGVLTAREPKPARFLGWAKGREQLFEIDTNILNDLKPEKARLIFTFSAEGLSTKRSFELEIDNIIR